MAVMTVSANDCRLHRFYKFSAYFMYPKRVFESRSVMKTITEKV